MPLGVLLAAAAVLGTIGVNIGRQLYLGSATKQGEMNFPPPRLWRRVLRLRTVQQTLEAAGWRTTSGYRSPSVNEKVNGASTSDHLDALAIDGVVDRAADEPGVLATLQQLKRDGFVAWWDVHDKGSGLHYHVKLAE